MVRRVLIFATLMTCGAVARCEGQWVAGVYAGAMHTTPAEIKIAQPAVTSALTFPDVPFRGESWDPPIYYGYRLGHALPGVPWLFLEGEFIHGKVFARGSEAGRGAGVRNGVAVGDVQFAAVVQGFSMSHGLNFILINAAVRRPLPGGRVTVVGRGGAGPLLPHAETEVEGRSREGYELAGAGLQASGGVELRMWRRLSVLADYKWTRARVEVSVDRGSATSTLRSHHFVLGLAAEF
ncbi:MAG TPA: hypothetical protein VK886_10835 [Vicinamibacterales bacterium]|nr:hypothetical protein [Vicinamibacterales bacterium]